MGAAKNIITDCDGPCYSRAEIGRQAPVIDFARSGADGMFYQKRSFLACVGEGLHACRWVFVTILRTSEELEAIWILPTPGVKIWVALQQFKK